jgi:hypothetical protein
MNGFSPTISIFGEQIGSFLIGGGAAANKYAKADLFRQLEGLIRPFLRCLGLRSSSYDPTRRRGTMGFPEGIQWPIFGG